MQLVSKVPKRRSDAARALADRRYHHRIVRDKKKYSRKGRASSMRKFEDSIQLANHSQVDRTQESTMKMVILTMMVVAGITTAHAIEPACKDSRGVEIYDADFCRAIQVSREAFELNRRIIERAEEMQKRIDRMTKDFAEGRAFEARP